jgi:hypothetical protein
VVLLLGVLVSAVSFDAVAQLRYFLREARESIDGIRDTVKAWLADECATAQANSCEELSTESGATGFRGPHRCRILSYWHRRKIVGIVSRRASSYCN